MLCGPGVSEQIPPGVTPLVPPGHHYSPIVDPSDPYALRAMQSEAHPRVTPAELGISEKEMTRWLRLIIPYYQKHEFPEKQTSGRRYWYDNPNFPLADAVALMAFMGSCRPRRYIELGCGYSSLAAADVAVDVEMTFIDPKPKRFVDLRDKLQVGELLEAYCQDVPLTRFEALDEGDILFIDSSHVAKTGSDVVYYLFHILPALRPGVIVHIHDIFWPFEYPEAWITGYNRSWNEAYLLRAFLQFNHNFKVLFMSDWAWKCHRGIMQQHMPDCVTHRGASLWMERMS